MATTDNQQAAMGKEVKFGPSQLSNPTPTWIKHIFRTILYLSAVWAIAAPLITEIPEHTLETVNKYLLLGNAIVNITIKFFGWDYTGN